ncbi:MAG: T9SS type A sorting domain-containing protein [Flavobacteriaceae bacterium]|nr:T9SS type A sorting domain-containing protein [Flavobacteriaceae bacterium]
MKKRFILLAMTLLGCTMHAQILTENFDNINSLPGWIFRNESDLPPPTGQSGWFQGNDTVFIAHEGSPDSYLGVNFSSSACCTISNWAILPLVTVQDGDTFRFYTRTIAGSIFPDRLEVRMSIGTTTDLPDGSEDVGSFTELLLTINENLEQGGYPEVWELQDIQLNSILSEPTQVRFAFRYFVTNGGVDGSNSNYIGIDSLIIDSELGANDVSEDFLRYRIEGNEHLLLDTQEPMELVELYAISGQKLISVESEESTEAIAIESLHSGIYILVVKTQVGIMSKKVIIP